MADGTMSYTRRLMDPSAAPVRRSPVMVNDRFGDFGFSQAAMDEYNRRRAEAYERPLRARDVPRHDPLMVQLVQELGPRVNGPTAKIRLDDLPTKYLGHYRIVNVGEGVERVQPRISAYKVDRVRGLLSDERLSDRDKLELIAAAVDEPRERTDDALNSSDDEL